MARQTINPKNHDGPVPWKKHIRILQDGLSFSGCNANYTEYAELVPHRDSTRCHISLIRDCALSIASICKLEDIDATLQSLECDPASIEWFIGHRAATPLNPWGINRDNSVTVKMAMLPPTFQVTEPATPVTDATESVTLPTTKTTAPVRQCVYFIQVATDGPIKIGTTSCVGQRVRDLQIGCPFQLRILGTMQGGDRNLERELHSTFAKLRLKGEWFTPDSTLLTWIREHCTEE